MRSDVDDRRLRAAAEMTCAGNRLALVTDVLRGYREVVDLETAAHEAVFTLSRHLMTRGNVRNGHFGDVAVERLWLVVAAKLSSTSPITLTAFRNSPTDGSIQRRTVESLAGSARDQEFVDALVDAVDRLTVRP